MVGENTAEVLQDALQSQTGSSHQSVEEGLVSGDGSPLEGELVPVKEATSTEGRDEKGRLLPGYTGNMSGRTRGIRNKITLDRLLLEDKLRVALERKSPKLLEKAIEMAMDGNDRIMRALLDKLLSTPKHDDPGEAKDNEIKILIQNLTSGPTPRPEAGVTTVKVTPSETTVERD